MELGDYVKIGIAVLVLGLVGVAKYQYNTIEEMKIDSALFERTNKDLSERIVKQNADLKEGQVKFDQAQADLNVAKGVNEALTQQYTLLRGTIKGKPIAKTCADAIVELKSTSNQIAKKWNSK